MRGNRLALGATVFGLLLAGCGGGGETAATVAPAGPPQEVPVTLDGYANPQNLGILMAEERLFFRDAGLSLFLAPPAAPQRPVPYVVNGTDELGVAHLPQVVAARATGHPVVVVGSLVSQPTTAMIWLRRSGIGSVADLKGKTIATPGVPGQEELLRAMLARAGLTPADAKVIDVGYDLVPALLDGRADAIFGGSENIEGAELESRGAKPVLTTPQELGAPDYEELVVIARADTVAADPALPRRFMAAVERGTALAINDPREALYAIEESAWGKVETARGVTRAQVEATLPLLSRSGRVDPQRAQELIDWMQEEGLIPARIDASKLIADSPPA